MSDNWDFYLGLVDDQPSSIFVDLGLAKEAPIKDFTHMGYIRIKLKSPREDGLSSQNEFEDLRTLEDSIVTALTADGYVMYVGRNTSSGYRDVYFYTSRPETWEAAVLSVMNNHQYEFECGTREDATWTTYFSFLYPEGTQMQQIKNRRTCEAFEHEGDVLEQEREVDHWAYFPNQEAQESYIASVTTLGFIVRNRTGPNESTDSFAVQVYRLDIPSYNNIDSVTLPLFNAAREVGGEYDGWEAPVITE